MSVNRRTTKPCGVDTDTRPLRQANGTACRMTYCRRCSHAPASLASPLCSASACNAALVGQPWRLAAALAAANSCAAATGNMSPTRAAVGGVAGAECCSSMARTLRCTSCKHAARRPPRVWWTGKGRQAFAPCVQQHKLLPSCRLLGVRAVGGVLLLMAATHDCLKQCGACGEMGGQPALHTHT